MSESKTLPVADRWFRSTRVDPLITLIREPHVNPWVSANMWHIQGKTRDLLVDSGMGVAALKPELDRLFSRSEPVVVITHSHLDHMGSAHEFADVWAHELEPTTSPGKGTLYGPELFAILGAEGLEFDEPNPLLVNALPHAGYDVDTYELVPVRPTRLLIEGDEVDLGDRVLTVLHLPGHTPGSIGLHDVANRTLFTGDVIYDPPDFLDNFDGGSRNDYKLSVARLLDLDIDVVHTGHGNSFDGVRLRELAIEYLNA